MFVPVHHVFSLTFDLRNAHVLANRDVTIRLSLSRSFVESRGRKKLIKEIILYHKINLK